MGFLLPVNTVSGSASVDGVSFDGATLFEIEAEVIKTARVTFAGATLLEFSHAQGAAQFAGATALTFSGRLNSEANVFGAVEFAGVTALDISPEGARGAGVSFDGSTLLELSPHLDRAVDFGFTFFVDIQDASIAAALDNNIRSYTGRLLVTGVAVPIITAKLEASEDRLGTELSVVLLRPDVTQITANSSVDFQLGIWTTGAWAWITLLEGGRMSGRGARYANQEKLPADSVRVTFVDVMGDRWNRRPNVPRIIYDPQIIAAPTVETIRSQSILDNEGASISPVYVTIPGMRLKDVLEDAYVAGCGFDKVVTNIDNFPVEQVVYSLAGGYDGGVRPLLMPFEPIFFVVGNDLWIVTLDNPLPAGFNARDFAASNIESVDDSLPARAPVNALLVHLKNSSSPDGEYYTERLETDTVSSGSFGSDGYTETDTERRVREYRNVDNPLVVVREEEVYVKVRVLDHEFNLISVETRTGYFDALNRPTGYLRKVESLLPDVSDPDGALLLQRSLEERQTITYAPHPLNPERDVQNRIVTSKSGLILTDNDNQYLGKPYKIRLADGHKSGYVNPDPGQTAQTSSFGELQTITETIRVNGGQVFRERRVIDHVSNVVDPPTSQVFPGDASFDRRREAGSTGGSTRTVMLTVPGTDATGSRVEDFDATGLPAEIGMRLAEKRLARLNNPPRELSVEMRYIDPTLRRGSDLNVFGRSGSLGTFIVRGYSITIEPNAEGVVEGKMTLNARELQQ